MAPVDLQAGGAAESPEKIPGRLEGVGSKL
jgi:hypothetical protein